MADTVLVLSILISKVLAYIYCSTRTKEDNGRLTIAKSSIFNCLFSFQLSAVVAFLTPL